MTSLRYKILTTIMVVYLLAIYISASVQYKNYQNGMIDYTKGRYHVINEITSDLDKENSYYNVGFEDGEITQITFLKEGKRSDDSFYGAFKITFEYKKIPSEGVNWVITRKYNVFNLTVYIGNAAYYVASLDNQGRVILREYYDKYDRPTIWRGDVYKIKSEYYSEDEYNFVKQYYLNNSYEVVNNIDGYAIDIYKYDNKNNLIETRYLDEKGNLSSVKGFAVTINKYDNKNNLIETRYLDEESNLVAVKGNIAIFKYKYDEKGNKIEYRFYGVNGEPTNWVNSNMYIQKFKFDYNGNEIEHSYHDSDGNLINENNEGYARYKAIYDDNGKCIEERFYTKDGKLISSEKHI